MTGDNFLFAHISDPHLSDLSSVKVGQLLSKRLLGYLSWQRRRRHEHRREVLDALHADLDQSGIEQLLVSGDLTHVGLPLEFQQARAWLDSLVCHNVAVVPGNHDSYVQSSWEQTYQWWQPFFHSSSESASSGLDGLFPTLEQRGDIAFIGLSSARPSPPFMATGRIGDRQLQKLRNLLQETGRKGLCRIVWLHHPPLPGQEKSRKSLQDAAELVDVLKAEGAELVLHGHRHRSECLRVNAAGRDIPVLSVPSASAVGNHAEAAAYNRILISSDQRGWLFRVENRVYDQANGCFEPGLVQELVVGKAGQHSKRFETSS